MRTRTHRGSFISVEVKVFDHKKWQKKLRTSLTRGTNKVHKRAAGIQTKGYKSSLPKSQSKIKATHKYRRMMRDAYGTTRSGIRSKKKPTGSKLRKLGYLASRWGVGQRNLANLGKALRKNASKTTKSQHDARFILRVTKPKSVPNMPYFHEFGAYGNRSGDSGGSRKKGIPENVRMLKGARTHASGKGTGTIVGEQYLNRWFRKFGRNVGGATQKEVKKAVNIIKAEMKYVEGIK